MAIIQKKDGRWAVYYRNPSPPPALIWEYFGRGATGRAAAIKRDAELGLRRTRPRKSDIDDGPPFVDLASEYVTVKDFRDPRNSPLYKLRKHILPAIGDITAIKISHNDLDRYISARRNSGAKNNTIRRELVVVKAILTWAVRRHPPLIPYNPVRDYQLPPNDDEVIMPPTAAEIQAILHHASPHIARCILITYYTGLRPGHVELLSLTWSHVMWDQCAIRIVSANKGGPILRDVPIHPEFLERLKAWWEKDGRGFGPIIHYGGKPIARVGNAWKRLLRRAGITRRLRPYDFRHLFVTQAIEAGADYKSVSDIVGSSPETLRKHYQHVSSASRQRVIAMIPALGNTGNNLSDETGKKPSDSG